MEPKVSIFFKKSLFNKQMGFVFQNKQTIVFLGISSLIKHTKKIRGVLRFDMILKDFFYI